MMKKYLPTIKNLLIKTALTAVSGGAFVFPDTILGMICAGSVVASVISSSISDNNLKPIMSIINHLAVNIDKAENNKEVQ